MRDAWLEEGFALRLHQLEPFRATERKASVWDPWVSAQEQRVLGRTLLAMLLLAFVTGFGVEYIRESARLHSHRAHEQQVRLYDCEPNSKPLEELDFVERAMLKLDPERHIELCRAHRERIAASVSVNPMHVLSVYTTSIALYPVHLTSESLLALLGVLLGAHQFVTQALILLALLGVFYVVMHHVRSSKRASSEHLPFAQSARRYDIRAGRRQKGLPYFLQDVRTC